MSEDANAAPPLPALATSRPGDLWLLGSHRVLCGDATDPELVSRLLGERKPLLMVTDPPYGIELDSEWRDRAGLNQRGPAEPSYLKHRTQGHRETSISGDILASPRIVYAFAESGDAPPFLANVNSTFRTPAFAICIYAALTWMLAVSGTFLWVAAVGGASTLILYSGG